MTTVNYNNTVYTIPENRSPRGWGTSLSAFLVDVANSSLSKAGGSFTLTADANFGPNYGVVAKYVKSVSSNIAASGVVRLANTDKIAFRNNANGADLSLGVSASDRLQFESVNVPTVSSTDTLTNKTLDAASNTITGLTKSDVGLGNVDNTSDATKNSVSATLTNKTINGANNTLTVRLANDVSGTLPIANGGTGQTSANNALNALLPTQTSNANKVLATDGSNTSWTAVATTVTTTQGDLIYRGASADTRLAGNTTTAKQYLTQTGNGSASAAPVWSAFPGATNCAAYSNTAQTGLTSGSSYVVAFNTEEYDNGSFYDTTTYRVQPTVAGKYMITWGVRLFGTSVNTVRVALTQLYKNGAAFKNGSGFGDSATAQCDSCYSSGSALVNFNGSTDYVEIRAFAFTTSSTFVIGDGQTNTYFSCVRVSD